MKYLASLVITIAVLYLYADRHPVGGPLPVWVDAIGGAVILTLPISTLCHLLTRKIGGLRARGVDLLILFFVAGIYWWISTARAIDPRSVSPVRFWFLATVTLWATLFLPYNGSLALIEWIGSRKTAKHG